MHLTSTVWDTFLINCKRISDITSVGPDLLDLDFSSCTEKNKEIKAICQKWSEVCQKTHTSCGHYFFANKELMKKQNITRILWNITGQKFVHSTEESENELYLDIRFYIFCLCIQNLQLGNLGECFHLNLFTSSISHFVWKHKFIIKTGK